MIELSLLIKKTIEYLKRKNLSELDLSESSRNPFSCWGQICISCKGYFEFKEAQYVKAIWEKNCKKFREKVIEKIDSDITLDHFPLKRVEIDLITAQEIKNNIMSKPRFYIKKAVIAKIISQKLQEFGVNCWFNCSYNWFSSSKNSRLSDWKGKFKCLSEKCIMEAKFNIESNFEQPIIFNLTWLYQEKHDE